MSLTTIKTFNNITSLGLVRSMLESEGIECFVKDEYMGQIYAGAGVESFNIKLQVREEDAETAISLLIEKGYAIPEDYAPDKTMLSIGRLLEKIKALFRKNSQND